MLSTFHVFVVQRTTHPTCVVARRKAAHEISGVKRTNYHTGDTTAGTIAITITIIITITITIAQSFPKHIAEAILRQHQQQ